MDGLPTVLSVEFDPLLFRFDQRGPGMKSSGLRPILRSYRPRVQKRTLHALLAMFGSAPALLGCNGGDRLGELQTKPIFALMSGAYYGGMCESKTGTNESAADVRAIRIHTSTGDCRVLYLDGVDRTGELLMYATKPGDRLQCGGLIQRLLAEDANAAVVARVRQRCG